MPSRPKKRAPSNRVYSSETNAKQVHFPSRRRSINRTNPTPPASRTRQQTLTQIDFVTKYLPQDDDVDLNYIEKEASPKRKRRTTLPSKDATTVIKEDGPSKRKRRKTLPAQNLETPLDEDRSPERRRRRTLPIKDTPSVIETRTSKRRKLKQEQESEKNVTSTTTEKRSNAAHTKASPARSELIPPRTPVTARKVEIPSSQSPADTPLSTQRTSSLRSPLRSPLKARSANVRVLLKDGLRNRKLTGWHPELEVKSSVSWENEDSQPLTVSPFLRAVGKGEYELRRSNVSNGMDSQRENERSKGALPRRMHPTEPLNKPMPNPQSDKFSKTEIRDSDEEEDDDDDEEASILHGVTNTTQPSEHNPSQLPHLLQPTSNQPSPLEAAPTPNADAPLLGPHTEPPVPPQTPTSPSYEVGLQNKDHNAPTKDKSTSPVHPLLPPISSAEGASAQLFNDLYRQPQTQVQPQHDDQAEDLYHPPTPTARLLDSQSQLGFICRDYTPSSPPLPPIGAAASLSKEPERSHNSASRSCSRSSSPSNHPRTSQVSTQSPVTLKRSLHQTAFSEAPPNHPYLQPSQFSTQSQPPLKNPDRTTHPALQPRPQQGPPLESRPSSNVVGSEPTLPSLPPQAADGEPTQAQQPSSPGPSDPDTDFLPPQTFLQSSPLLAPSLPPSPLLSKIHLQYDSQCEDDDESHGEDGTAEVSFEGERDVWDGRVKTTSQFLPESMFDDESQNLRFDMPPGFSSQLLEQD